MPGISSRRHPKESASRACRRRPPRCGPAGAPGMSLPRVSPTRARPLGTHPRDWRADPASPPLGPRPNRRPGPAGSVYQRGRATFPDLLPESAVGRVLRRPSGTPPGDLPRPPPRECYNPTSVVLPRHPSCSIWIEPTVRPPSRRPTGAAPVAALAASLCLASCQPRVSSRPALALLGPIPIRLVEMAGPAGVRFTHQNGASAQKYFPEIMGAGVGLLDYDGDGRVDLLFVNGREWRRPGPESTLRLYRNETTPAANDHPVGPPVLKFREVTREAGLTLSLYGMGCAVGDYNGDGWPD
ncbi:MAG: hypothetical protein FJX77_11445, partial [Armatimonadetes bacterium]|nr:hypothetical protein [Armatimonadota bacterium]